MMTRLPLPFVLLSFWAANALCAESVPDKLVILTFDDSVESHFTIVRPILLRYGFGATFFITEGFDFSQNKDDYMTWEQIGQLHRDGFEIGNHTTDHSPITDRTLYRLPAQLQGINAQCKQHGIPKPVSFAYPANAFTLNALPILQQQGILFARRGGMPEQPYDAGRGFAYEPGLDHPLLIPSAGDARPAWTLEDFQRSVEQARHGRVAVLKFHGVPDRTRRWLQTSREQFEAYMKYLSVHDYRVIAMRDLTKYVDPALVPRNPLEVHADRRRALAAGRSRHNFRKPTDDKELRSWLENMLLYHEFSIPEAAAATGLTAGEIEAASRRLGLQGQQRPQRDRSEPLVVLPYPGGRHPRVGFLDGAMRPQRETKVSVFTPWEGGGYVVVDVPEAVWLDQPQGQTLLYLAHTHVQTMWSKQNIELAKLEWQPAENRGWRVERELPNRVTFGAQVTPTPQAVRMELWITNGTDTTLTGLRVQNCVMLKAAQGFNQQDSNNKLQQSPYIACRNSTADRWIITAWEPCVRTWANPPCPCMHSDPQFPDCAPGQTQRVRGWLSFYEGANIQAELQRIAGLNWARD